MSMKDIALMLFNLFPASELCDVISRLLEQKDEITKHGLDSKESRNYWELLEELIEVSPRAALELLMELATNVDELRVQVADYSLQLEQQVATHSVFTVEYMAEGETEHHETIQMKSFTTFRKAVDDCRLNQRELLTMMRDNDPLLPVSYRLVFEENHQTQMTSRCNICNRSYVITENRLDNN